VIGTFNGGTSGSTPLVVSFNSLADVTAVQAVLRNITYENVVAAPDASDRTVTFVLSDGDGGVSNVESEQINIIASNHAPVATDDSHVVNEDTLLDTDNLWYDANWQFRRQLTFDNTAQTENLTEFPVLIKLNSSRIDYSQTQDAGQDIRFTDADGTLLTYEIESWEESRDSYVWVNSTGHRRIFRH